VVSGRVLIVVENLSVPADRRVWQESRALVSAGYDVDVICPRGAERDIEPFEVREGVRIHRFDSTPSGGGAAGYVREYGVAAREIVRLAVRLGRPHRFGVIHACNPPDLILPALLPLRRRRTRFLFDHHDLVPELYRTRFGRRDPLYAASLLLERLTYALADVVVATNESYRRIAIERGKKRPEDVFVVRNAPDLSRFVPGAPEPALARGRPHLIAYVGVMGAQDGVDVALRALAHLRARDDWHALFVGDGDAMPELRRLAGELELDARVEFAGWQDDTYILRVLSTAAVCLSPEPSNPLNDASTMIKVAEYMAMRRPVVAFDLPESRFTAGDAAIFAASGDIEAYAAAVGRLLDDAELRERLGAAGRQRIEEELSWDRSVEALLVAYERVLRR
jgi:glycosyltransferase involved in cell wall biosynthesis